MSYDLFASTMGAPYDDPPRKRHRTNEEEELESAVKSILPPLDQETLDDIDDILATHQALEAADSSDPYEGKHLKNFRLRKPSPPKFFESEIMGDSFDSGRGSSVSEVPGSSNSEYTMFPAATSAVEGQSDSVVFLPSPLIGSGFKPPLTSTLAEPFHSSPVPAAKAPPSKPSPASTQSPPSEEYPAAT